MERAPVPAVPKEIGFSFASLTRSAPSGRSPDRHEHERQRASSADRLRSLRGS